MPAERGLRDLEILLGQRDRLPVDVVTYLATTDIPAGDRPPDAADRRRSPGGRLHRRANRVAVRAVLRWTQLSAGSAHFADEQLEQLLPRRRISPGFRSASTRSATRRSSRSSRPGSASTSLSTPRARRHFRRAAPPRRALRDGERGSCWSAPRCSGSRSRCNRRFDAAWGQPGRPRTSRASGWERAAPMNPFRGVDRAWDRGRAQVRTRPITTIDPLRRHRRLRDAPRPDCSGSRARRRSACSPSGARASHTKRTRRGALEPGKHADFAVYDVDPLEAAYARRGAAQSSPSRSAETCSQPDRARRQVTWDLLV